MMNGSTIVRGFKTNNNGRTVSYITFKVDEIPTILKMLKWEDAEDAVNNYDIIEKTITNLQNTKLGAITKNITLEPVEMMELHILSNAYLRHDKYNYIITKLNNYLSNTIDNYINS